MNGKYKMSDYRQMHNRALSWYFNLSFTYLSYLIQKIVKILSSQLIFVCYKCSVLIQTCSRTIILT